MSIIDCPTCNGFSSDDCITCWGIGRIKKEEQPCPECGGSGEYCPIKESCNKPNTCHEEFTDELGDKYPHCEMICACKCKGTGTKEAL